MKRIAIALVAAAMVFAVLLFWTTPPGAMTVGSEPAAPRSSTAAAGGIAEESREGVATQRRELPSSDGRLHGTVEVLVLRESDEQPTAGVGVTLLPDDGRDEQLAQLRGATGADGLVSWDGLAAGPYRAEVERGPSVDVALPEGQRVRATLRVHDGIAVTGTVVDDADRPVSGAEVWLFRGSGSLSVSEPFHVATTNDAGQFRLSMGHGSSWLQARMAEHAPSSLCAVPHDPPPEGLTLRLGHAGALLRGVVTAAGARVAWALIGLERPPSVQQQNEHDDRSARSAEDGRFEMQGLQPGPAILRVRSSRCAPKAVEVELAADKVTEIALQLDPGGMLRGTVRDLQGRPLAHAQASVPIPPASQARAITTAEGIFLLESLPVGTVDVTVGNVVGYCGRQLRVTLTPGEETICEVVLEPLPMLRGRVVDEAGRGLCGQMVQAIRVDNGRGFHKAMTDEQGRVDLEYGRSDVTRADGNFTLGVMPGVEYLLDVHEKDQWFAVEGERFGRFSAPRDGIVLTIQPEERATASVQGRVIDPFGKPVAGAWFELHDGRRIGRVGVNTPGTQRSAADGAFRIGPVPACGYVLKVIPEDPTLAPFETTRLSLHPDQVLDLGDVAMPALARLTVRVHRADSAPLRGAMLSLRVGFEIASIFEFGADGVLDRAIAPGSYVMAVYGEGFPTREEVLEIGAGEHRHLEYTVPAGITFHLHCALPAGEQRARLIFRATDGTVEFEELLAPEDRAPYRWAPYLTPGQHTAELACSSRKRYMAKFTVAEQHAAPGTRPESLELIWTPLR